MEYARARCGAPVQLRQLADTLGVAKQVLRFVTLRRGRGPFMGSRRVPLAARMGAWAGAGSSSPPSSCRLSHAPRPLHRSSSSSRAPLSGFSTRLCHFYHRRHPGTPHRISRHAQPACLRFCEFLPVRSLAAAVGVCISDALCHAAVYCLISGRLNVIFKLPVRSLLRQHTEKHAGHSKLHYSFCCALHQAPNLLVLRFHHNLVADALCIHRLNCVQPERRTNSRTVTIPAVVQLPGRHTVGSGYIERLLFQRHRRLQRLKLTRHRVNGASGTVDTRDKAGRQLHRRLYRSRTARVLPYGLCLYCWP